MHSFCRFIYCGLFALFVNSSVIAQCVYALPACTNVIFLGVAGQDYRMSSSWSWHVKSNKDH